jgi:hypothetical protein
MYCYLPSLIFLWITFSLIVSNSTHSDLSPYQSPIHVSEGFINPKSMPNKFQLLSYTHNVHIPNKHQQWWISSFGGYKLAGLYCSLCWKIIWNATVRKYFLLQMTLYTTWRQDIHEIISQSENKLLNTNWSIFCKEQWLCQIFYNWL